MTGFNVWYAVPPKGISFKLVLTEASAHERVSHFLEMKTRRKCHAVTVSFRCWKWCYLAFIARSAHVLRNVAGCFFYIGGFAFETWHGLLMRKISGCPVTSRNRNQCGYTLSSANFRCQGRRQSFAICGTRLEIIDLWRLGII